MSCSYPHLRSTTQICLPAPALPSSRNYSTPSPRLARSLPHCTPAVCSHRAISNAFTHLPRRKRHGFVTALGRRSVDAMARAHGSAQVDALLRHVDAYLATGGAKSASADAKLLQVRWVGWQVGR